MNAIVAGQTSVKSPEQQAFEKYLPDDTHIISLHSLHGPTVSPLGQPLVCHILEAVCVNLVAKLTDLDIHTGFDKTSRD
jgi:prephenate dehydrogenase